MARFIQGDYQYTTLGTSTNVRARVNDTTKSSYEDIPASVTYGGVEYSVTNMYYCFENCTSLTQAPAIPNSVTNMNYCFYNCTSLTQVLLIPDSVTSMDSCFENCTSLAQAPVIPNGVTDMSSCFYGCTSLTTAPTIPNSVTSIYFCFRGCTSLTQAPVIPSSVTNMNYCFYGCTSLTQAPVIPSSVIDMGGCFQGCTSLTQAPVIHSSVISVYSCFRGCTSLTTAPVIPSSVINMATCFYGCTSLTTAPVIPSSVTDMSSCFYGCTSLMGDIYILKTSYFTSHFDMFYNTVLPITLHSYYNNAQTWANTANNSNVTVGGVVKPTLLNTQFIGTGKYRVDMLLDCTESGSITGITPNGALYDMNDNEIEFGVDIDFVPQFVRCYTIVNTRNQVPNANTSITIKNVAPSSFYQSVSIGTPSTATPSVIKQEGETTLISPRIDVSDIRLNPQTTDLPYTVGEFVGVTATNMTKSQTNVDNDVKHIVTHASNVRVDDTTTLQDWITEQYNNLT